MKSQLRQEWTVNVRQLKFQKPFLSKLQWLIVVVLVMGIFLRFANIDRKVYWHDEALTSLRIFGYSKTELVQNVFDGELTTAAELQRYQQPSPDKDLSDTLTALMGNAEHPPLYYLGARFWAGLFGPSVSAMRSLTAILSLLSLPCVYWLCLELFGWPLVGWIAIALVAISPIHILYAQEAREYSLWSATILFSSASFLRAIRLQTRWDWGLYALSLSLGLYTQLFTVLVSFSHALYIAFNGSIRTSKIVISYLWASLAAFLSFSPWLFVILNTVSNIHEETAGVREPLSFSDLLDDWFLNFNRVFLDYELGAANLLFVVLTFASIGFLYYKAPRKIWVFVIALTGVTALALVFPDLLTAGRSSTRIRYLFPSCLGIQLAVAYFLATQITAAQVWRQRFGRGLVALLLSAGIIGGILSSQTTVWWTKSVKRSGHYLPVAEIINQAKSPLVISNDNPINILAFSRYLDPNVKLLLKTPSEIPQLPEIKGKVFLLDPSPQFYKQLVQTERYRIRPAHRRDNIVHLWKIRNS